MITIYTIMPQNTLISDLKLWFLRNNALLLSDFFLLCSVPKEFIYSILYTLIYCVTYYIFRQLNDITGYTPYGARARTEHTRYQEFFAHDGLGLAVYIFATAKDDGTMLRTDHLKEVIDVSVTHVFHHNIAFIDSRLYCI